MSARPARRAGPVAVGLAFALAFAMLAGAALGAVGVTPAEVVGAVARAARGAASSASDAVVVDIRLPRVVLAALVGACLAVAGLLYQALFRNPLADPYILGVSSGAGLGVVLVLAATAHATALRVGLVPVAAFAGALLTILLVVRLATRAGRVEPTSLLLAGVAISYTLAALTSFVMVFSRESMASVVFWMMGGLAGASWVQVLVVACVLVPGCAAAWAIARELNLMLLGDERAGQLGVAVPHFRGLALAAGSVLTAAAVSVSGLVGFVGLMTPHALRLVLGPDHRRLVPASLLGGALVMVLADLVARTVLAPVELPVGIITALLGGPFFVWLLVRKDAR